MISLICGIQRSKIGEKTGKKSWNSDEHIEVIRFSQTVRDESVVDMEEKGAGLRKPPLAPTEHGSPMRLSLCSSCAGMTSPAGKPCRGSCSAPFLTPRSLAAKRTGNTKAAHDFYITIFSRKKTAQSFLSLRLAVLAGAPWRGAG